MTQIASITVTIAFNDPDLDMGSRDQQAQGLMAELNQLDEVSSVDRVPDPNPPQGNKAGGGFLPGILMAEVNVANAKKLMGFLGERMVGKPIELSVEGNGKKLSVKANNAAELAAAIKAAQDFIG